MNSKRSYLDAVNAGRQRRSYASLEQLNRSLESLEQRLERNREEPSLRQPAMRPAPEPAGFTLPRTPAQQRASERGENFDPSYQTIARDLERVRRDADSIKAFGTIASEIQGLREELRHQMTSSVSREFDALRKDFRQGDHHNGQERSKLNEDVQRLFNAVQALGERGDDRDIEMLRKEIGQLKDALGTVAREETVRSVDQRFNELESRIAVGAATYPATSANQEDLAALTDRLDRISRAVDTLPESLPLGDLGEKVRTLAMALDTFIERQDGQTNQIFGHIEERLDEISRAIVSATMAAQKNRLDPEPFERLEARISALAKQIEEVTEDRASADVVEHLQALAHRVDALATQTTMPEEAIDRLAGQISDIANKIDRVPAMPDAGELFSGIENRLDTLSNLFQRRQDDAIEQANTLFRELERRLNEVAERIDQRPATQSLDSDSIMQAIDRRFSDFAQTMGATSHEGLADDTVRALEARLENISRRLDESASQFASLDPDLVRNLEAQVAGLSEHLARPGAALPEFVDISPRLMEIEKSISENRESILEAARAAAETTARSLAASQPGSAALSGFGEELKALEELTRRSDERNSKTFEAIHDTLLKIVDRMGSLEREARNAELEQASVKLEIADAPPLDDEDVFTREAQATSAFDDRTPAQAASEAALASLGSDVAEETGKKAGRRSLLGGLTRAFRKTDAKVLKKGEGSDEPALPGTSLPEASQASAPEVALDAPLDPKLANRLLEPGSGAPDLSAIMKRVRDERAPETRKGETDPGKSDFIAAARRAAQAAAAESDVRKRKSDVGSPVKALRISDVLKTRRKHLLLGAAALVTALAGLQIGMAVMADKVEITDAASPAVKADAIQTHVLQPETSATLSANTKIETDATSSGAGQADLAQPASLDRFGGEEEIAASDLPLDDLLVASVPAAEPMIPEEINTPELIDVPVNFGSPALRDAAAGGDARALFAIAGFYAEGSHAKAGTVSDVAPDMAKAAEWYEKSAELGFAPAQYRIGNMYEKGIGVARDLPRARDWYLKAAEQGNASAMHNLAVLYAMGAAGTADNDAAAKWFIEAAELGIKDSQFNLGILSAKGVGMKQSLEESYKWFALVAKTGDRDAATKRDEIGKALRPEQLERARAATELWRPRKLVADVNSFELPEAWSADAQTASAIDPASAVKIVQEILNRNGYDAGSADGVMGSKTKAAIAQFQKDNGMEPTGKVDEKLLRNLTGRG